MLKKIIPANETTVPETGEVSKEQLSILNIQPSTQENKKVYHHSHAAHG